MATWLKYTLYGVGALVAVGAGYLGYRKVRHGRFFCAAKKANGKGKK